MGRKRRRWQEMADLICVLFRGRIELCRRMPEAGCRKWRWLPDNCQKLTGIFKIEPVLDYSPIITDALLEARKTKREAVTELKTYRNVEPYDVITLGFSNYWGTKYRWQVFTFLEHFHFSLGRTIRPSVPQWGSWAWKRILWRCPRANLREGLQYRGNGVNQSEERHWKWLWIGGYLWRRKK